MRITQIITAIVTLLIGVSQAMAIDPYVGNDPWWVLLHEPSVVKELKLSDSQKVQYRQLLDRLDIRFFPLRNQSHDRVTTGLKAILSEAREGMTSILDNDQQQRLEEILFQHQGNATFLRPEIVSGLKLSQSQQDKMRKITASTESAVHDLYAAKNTDSSASETQYVKLKTEEQKKLLAVLKPDQLNEFKKRIGSPFPLDSLRKPAFKAPEIIDTKEWINSTGVNPLSSLRGKVVAVHFYACGCINCIHNYPFYRQWHDQFKDKDFVLLGIHTPETSRERDMEFVRKKAEEEKLKFPILIDPKEENWNAWGNSMWPSIYLIDKNGYLRDFWPGELNWQGNDGERQMRARIEELLSASEEVDGTSKLSRSGEKSLTNQ